MHQDEFDAFCSFYRSTWLDRKIAFPKDANPNAWHHRCVGTLQRHYVHILAEQATVQLCSMLA